MERESVEMFSINGLLLITRFCWNINSSWRRSIGSESSSLYSCECESAFSASFISSNSVLLPLIS